MEEVMCERDRMCSLKTESYDLIRTLAIMKNKRTMQSVLDNN
jgi:hypothetical protein